MLLLLVCGCCGGVWYFVCDVVLIDDCVWVV